MKAVGRIPIGAAPRALAAPVLGETLYVLTSGGDNSIQCVDVRTDRVTSPLINSDFGRPLSTHYAQGLAVSPDNRVLMITGTEDGSPSCRPDPYILSGQKATSYYLTQLHTDHGPAYVLDLVGGRLYAGGRVYSLDLRERIGELPSLISVPHPTKNLIFGSKKGQRRGGLSETLLVIDEEKLTSIAEIEIGDDIRALVPTETKIYIVGPASIYPLDLPAIVPADALAKPKARRIPVDLAKAVPEADIKKAQALNADAQRLIESGKFDEAGSKFDQAYALDPLSGAKAGQGQVLVRKKSLPEAIELLKVALNHPFRNPATRFEVYAYLGVAYGQSNQNEAAIRTFQEGLRFEPKDVLLLKNLGIAHGNAGNLALAYVAWSSCLLADPNQTDARKLLDEATKRLVAGTTARCDSCRGDGKFEAVVQEQGAAKRKIMSDCKTCKASGKTWRRPCVECQATGRKFPDNYCDKCYGRGSVPEPAK